jgi:uncharacterized protein
LIFQKEPGLPGFFSLCFRLHIVTALVHNCIMKKLLFSLACLAGSLSAWGQNAPQLDLPRVTLSAGMHQINAQVAQTPEQRQTGLMFRQSMPQPEGMLFIFEQAATQCFWMRNTLIPLQTAFVADDGAVVNIVDMKPLDETSRTCSDKPVRFVLEMNQGWFSKKGIKAGFKLSGQPFKP